MKKLLFFIQIFLNVSFAQNGYNNYWNVGNSDNSSFLPPWYGNFQLRFSTLGFDNFILIDYGCDIRWTNACISDYIGNFQFYTNGLYIGNVLGDTMQNGAGLWKTGGQPGGGVNGSDVSQGALILPDPSNSNKYLLFHVSDSIGAGGYHPPLDLYMSGIDMTLVNGLGAVTYKNVSVLHDSLISGFLTACRHANGRDWWLVTNKLYTNLYYKLLITPNGVAQVDTQSIGSIRGGIRGQACFSPNGAHYAQYDPIKHLQILDFDRCTGEFSNSNYMPIFDWNAGSGVCFSSNSNLLYASSSHFMYQFNLDTNDVIASRITVAVNDSAFFLDTMAQTAFTNSFYEMQMAQDGIIYISIFTSANRYGRILNSNIRGLGCNVDQHSFLLPKYTEWGLPNHPNYHLGSETGSVCDSLPPWVVGNSSSKSIEFKTFVYPNPVQQVAYIVLSENKKSGELRIFNALGMLVYFEAYNLNGSEIKISTSNWPSGLYTYHLNTNNGCETGKFVVKRE